MSVIERGRNERNRRRVMKRERRGKHRGCYDTNFGEYIAASTTYHTPYQINHFDYYNKHDANHILATDIQALHSASSSIIDQSFGS